MDVNIHSLIYGAFEQLEQNLGNLEEKRGGWTETGTKVRYTSRIHGKLRNAIRCFSLDNFRLA